MYNDNDNYENTALHSLTTTTTRLTRRTKVFIYW